MKQVTEPTRGDNTLDLFLTNNQTLISQWKVIDGISDHSAVLVDGLIAPKRTKELPRRIPLYKKGNWDLLGRHMEQFYQEMRVNITQDANVDYLWCSKRH